MIRCGWQRENSFFVEFLDRWRVLIGRYFSTKLDRALPIHRTTEFLELIP